MILERTKNAKRNLFWGIITNIIKIGGPFAIRTAIIYNLGIQYIGLSGLFSSILSSLSLAELGFDTAIVTIMYKGVADNDMKSLSALLNVIKKAYIIIGSFILITGVLLMPFLRNLIKDFDQIPSNINIYVIYSIYLMSTVVSYFFGGYRKSVLEAYQRLDLVSTVTSVIMVIFYLLEILVILLIKDFYFYIFIVTLGNIALNLVIANVTKNRFPDVKPIGTITETEKKSLKKILTGTIFGKVGAVLSVSFDNMVISTMLGITILAYYNNYALIITSIQGFLVIIYTSIQAGIGNSVKLESIEKNYNDMRSFSFMYGWIVSWCSFMLLYLFQPFIQLWLGKESVLPNIVVVFIVLNFYLTLCGGIYGTYKNAIGIWWEDRYRCLVGGIVNLALNISLVVIIGHFKSEYALAGVVLSTILSNLLILFPWSLNVLFKKYFINGLKRYVMDLLFYFAVTIISILIALPLMELITNSFDNSLIYTLVVKAGIGIILPNVIYLLFYYKTDVFKKSVSFIRSKILQR